MSIKVVLGLDDFYSCNHNLNKLDELNRYFDRFKITVFAIPQCLPEDWVRAEVLPRTYIQVALHGRQHNMFECRSWDTLTAIKHITACEEDYTVRGFKAPFWVDSEGTMEACLKLGYWMAGNPETTPYGRIPKGLKLFYHDWDIAHIPEEWDKEYLKLHGHIHDVCGNGLCECFEEVKRLPKESEFVWIDTYMKETGGDTITWNFQDDIPYDCYNYATHEIYQGNMEVDTVNKLWSLAKANDGDVLDFGNVSSIAVFGASVSGIIATAVLNFNFDIRSYVDKYSMRLLSVTDALTPEAPGKLPKEFRAKILYVDEALYNYSVVKALYGHILSPDIVTIIRNGDSFRIESKGEVR